MREGNRSIDLLFSVSIPTDLWNKEKLPFPWSEINYCSKRNEVSAMYEFCRTKWVIEWASLLVTVVTLWMYTLLGIPAHEKRLMSYLCPSLFYQINFISPFNLPTLSFLMINVGPLQANKDWEIEGLMVKIKFQYLTNQKTSLLPADR